MTDSLEQHVTRLQQNWEDFVERGIINEDVHPAVARSWQKCRQHGLDPNSGIGRQVSPEVFESIREANRSLVSVALPIMRSVFDIVADSHFLLVLTDSAGYLLETIGDVAIAEAAKDLRFEQGSLWSDLQVGTNALSVALDYDLAIQLIGPEHYCVSHQGWVCSAAPIHGLTGEVIGCLNLSGNYEQAHPHTLGVVKAAAFGIEQQLFSIYNGSLMRIALDNNPESILLLDEQFHPIWANKQARKTMGISTETLSGLDFRAMMPGIDWTRIERWDKDTRFYSDNTPLLIGEHTIYCGVNITPTLLELNKRAFTVNIKKQEQVIKAVNSLSGNHASYTFADIATGNDTMRKTIAIAERFASYDGNVLIEGEIGVGKEIIAQAIHNASARSVNSFVTINCASIPRGLIESELFGYEKGFAVGGAQDGYPGKLELADHGTVYLSDIDELSLEAQGELLQVVQTRSVKRIGAMLENELDVRFIVASSKNLRNEVDCGRFRADLFVSLNVLRLDIAPLRERPEDIISNAQRTLNHFNQRYPKNAKTMSDGFLHGLEIYSWPGNVKELQNCIERAFFANNSNILRREDLAGSIDMSDNSNRSGHQARQKASDESWLTGPVVERRQVRIWDQEEYNGIIDALRRADCHVGQAAPLLGLSRASLYRRIAQLNIDIKQLRRKMALDALL